MQQITDITAVKNASAIMLDNGTLVCLHYDSEIIRISAQKEVKSLYVPSVTSAKMAKRCLDYMGVNYDWAKLKKEFAQ